jgi:hypothetical protein
MKIRIEIPEHLAEEVITKEMRRIIKTNKQFLDSDEWGAEDRRDFRRYKKAAKIILGYYTT